MDIIAQHHPTYLSNLYEKDTLFSLCKKIRTQTRCCIQPRLLQRVVMHNKVSVMHINACWAAGIMHAVLTASLRSLSPDLTISTVLCGSLTASTELWVMKMKKKQRNLILAVLILRLKRWQFCSVGLFGHSVPVWNISTTLTWTDVSPVDEPSWL